MPSVELMLGTVWDSLGERYKIYREAPDTWPQPDTQNSFTDQVRETHRFLGSHHLPQSVTFEEIGNTAIRAALDQLLGTKRWQDPERWGSLLVTFPESTNAWTVPSINWHLDYPTSEPSAGLTAVRIFTCLARLNAGMGGTVFLAGSHRLLENILCAGERLSSSEARSRLTRAYPWVKALFSRAESGNRVQRLMTNGATLKGVKVQVVEMMGEPGDVLLVHPMILHAPALNCSSYPRFVLSTTVFRI